MRVLSVISCVLPALLFVGMRPCAAQSATPDLSGPAFAPASLDSIRVMYVDAIYERVTPDAVLDALDRAAARRDSIDTDEPDIDALYTAYRGAATVLRARDAVWPGSKLKYTRRGLALLDDLVASHPNHVELRFLRLISCYRLPGFLGRGWSVEEDMHVVVDRFETLQGQVPAAYYNEVDAFVRDHGQPQRNTDDN